MCDRAILLLKDSSSIDLWFELLRFKLLQTLPTGDVGILVLLLGLNRIFFLLPLLDKLLPLTLLQTLLPWLRKLWLRKLLLRILRKLLLRERLLRTLLLRALWLRKLLLRERLLRKLLLRLLRLLRLRRLLLRKLLLRKLLLRILSFPRAIL